MIYIFITVNWKNPVIFVNRRTDLVLLKRKPTKAVNSEIYIQIHVLFTITGIIQEK